MELKNLRIQTTLESYLKANLEKGCEFRLVVQNSVDGKVEIPEFYIHPLDRDGDTLTYKVLGDMVECISEVLPE